jgi:hypothetical protein
MTRVLRLFSTLLLLLLLLPVPVMAAPAPPAEARLVLAEFNTGIMGRDRALLDHLFSPDAKPTHEVAEGLKFDGPAPFLDYLMAAFDEFPVSRVIQDKAVWTPRPGGGWNVGPLVMLESGGDAVTAWNFGIAERPQGWRIVALSASIDGVPAGLFDEARPETRDARHVQFHLTDAGSGKPIAARISIHDMSGRYWPPQGHQAVVPITWNERAQHDVRIDGRPWAYVPADFLADLVPGRYKVEVNHGLEFRARTFEITVAERPQPVTLALDRWSNMAAQGWYAGDTHEHISMPATARLEAQAEGLSVVNVTATKFGNQILGVDAFTGGLDPASTPDTLIWVGIEARHVPYGHAGLLGLKAPVYPLSWGSAPLTGVPKGLDYPPMATLLDEAHRQGGLTTSVHFPWPTGETAVDAALGKFDTVDLLTWGDPYREKPAPNRASADVWYGLLNCGIKLGMGGGSDKMLNSQVIGTPRVYVKTDGPLTYPAWLEGLRAGRSFATTGPMLSLTADGQDIGATLNRQRGDRIQVTAEVRTIDPLDRLEIIQDGKVIASAAAKPGEERVVLKAEVKVGGGSWLAARTISSGPKRMSQKIYFNPNPGVPVTAHTSPIWIDVAGSPRRSAEDASFFLTWVADGEAFVRDHARVANEAQRQEMLDLYARARAFYEAQLKD